MLWKGGKVKTVLEYKWRGMTRHKYPTVILSLSKYMAFFDFARVGIENLIFIVEFNDGEMIYWKIDKDDPDPDIRWGGRTTRKIKDKDDMEPVVHFEISKAVSIIF